MPRIKPILRILTLLLALAACIKPFDPLIEDDQEDKYVVSGAITDQEGWQTVSISVSSPIENPQYIPLSGCLVSILDDQGNAFDLVEGDPGNYSVWMDQQDLAPGTAFRIRVITPAQAILESDFDVMPGGPEIDSVYFIREEHLTTVPSVNTPGLQFYVDLDARGSESRFFKWEVVETWEYHAVHAKEYYYDGSHHAIVPPDSSTYFCWSTNPVKNIFTLSTQNLSENSYHLFPLHFVDGSSSRLSVLYSMLLRQYALSEAAYNYWEQLRINSNEQGGLYEKQPLAIQGNIRDVSGGKEVLGFFYAASVKSQRMFILPIEDLVLDYPTYCVEYTLGHFGWAEFLPKEYPVYYYFTPYNSLFILIPECVECERMGGSTIKPGFWPI